MSHEQQAHHGTVAQYLDAATVMAIEGLSVRARCVADGMLVGVHRSHKRGESAEFAEHKLYAPGDDVRRIDWRSFGKSDRYYLKRFAEETSLNVYLVVDESASMHYPDQGRYSKYQYAATLASALAYLLLRQADAVSLLTFGTTLNSVVPLSARSSQLVEICSALERVKSRPSAKTNAQQAFASLAERLRRRAMIVVISDLLGVAEAGDRIDAMLEGLAVCSARGADVSLIQTLDSDELDLPFRGIVRFDDIEGDAYIEVDTYAIRDAYQEQLQLYLRRLAQKARSLGIAYQLAATTRPPAEVLTRLFAERNQGRQVKA